MIEKPSDCYVMKIKFGRIAQIAQRIFFGFAIFMDLFLGPSLLGIYFLGIMKIYFWVRVCLVFIF